MSNFNLKNYVAEFIGTYFLLFFGTGAMIVNQVYGGVIGHLGIAFAWGFVVIAMIYALGEKSGAHINPAVTIAFLVLKKISFKKSVGYIISQLLGAIFASFTLFFMFPEATTMGETIPVESWQQAFIMEFILSFFLMFVIINVATGSKEQGIIAGFAIGISVMICALVGGPISVASMNPARSIAPALAIGNFEHLWMYIVSPILGMVSAVGVWKVLK